MTTCEKQFSKIEFSSNYQLNKNYFTAICLKLIELFNDEEIKKDTIFMNQEFEKNYKTIVNEIDEIEKENKNSETKVLLKTALKLVLVDFEKITIETYNLQECFNRLLTELELTNQTFIEIFYEAKNEKYLDFHSQHNSKILIGMVKSELPLMLQRIFDISTGSFIKNDGTKMTLKEYAKITNQDLKYLNILLNSAKKLIEKKIHNYGFDNSKEERKGA